MSTVEIAPLAAGVTMIRLDRPERLNALDYTCVSELHDALDTVAADDSCRVIVLTGAGRGFCAGLDLKNFGRVPEIGEHRHRHAGISGQAFLANLAQHIHDTPQVVIAAINGPAYGGGLALACASDLRIASESATMASAFIRTGLTGTDVGITYFLPRLIGASRAFDLILTGRTIDAAEAERMGLVSRVVADAALLATATEMAEQMAAFTSFGLRRTKEVMWHNLEASSVAAAIALENRNQELGAREPEVLEFMQRYSAQRVGPKPASNE
ncbi:MAG: putative enoyl-CoA hydratase/isomerase [Ilumatobacteraceae bacterium]|nr:putative enoyl-CoA hydratase/isomerase [Ilumatobacteraceae bacterium]